MKAGKSGAGTFGFFVFFMAIIWVLGFISDVEALFLIKWGIIFWVFSLVVLIVWAIITFVFLTHKGKVV